VRGVTEEPSRVPQRPALVLPALIPVAALATLKLAVADLALPSDA